MHKLSNSDKHEYKEPNEFLCEMLTPFSRYFKGNLDYDSVEDPSQAGVFYKRAKEIFGSSTEIVTQADVDRVNKIIQENTKDIETYLKEFIVDDETKSIVYNSLIETKEKYEMLEHVLYIEAKRGGYPVSDEKILEHQEVVDRYMTHFYGEKLSDTSDERNLTIHYIEQLDTSRLTVVEKESLGELIEDIKKLGYNADRVAEIQDLRNIEKKSQHRRHRTHMFKHFGRGFGAKFIPLDKQEIEELLSMEEEAIEKRMEDNKIHTNARIKKNNAGEDMSFTYKRYKERKVKLATKKLDVTTRVAITNKVLGMYANKFPTANISKWKAEPTSASGSSSKHEEEKISISDKVRNVNDFLSIDIGHELELHGGKGSNSNDYLGKGFIGAGYRDIEEGYAKIFELITSGNIQSLADLKLYTLPGYHPAMLSTLLCEQYSTDKAKEYLRIIKKAAGVDTTQIQRQVDGEIYKAKRFHDDDLPGANRVLINAYVRGYTQAAEQLLKKGSLGEVIQRYKKTHLGKIGAKDMENIQLIDIDGNQVQPLFIGYLIKELLQYGNIDSDLLSLSDSIPGLGLKSLVTISSIKNDLEKTLLEE